MKHRMKTTHKIICGDSRRMNHVEDSSVHLIITSPPYWQLKDYGKEEQIGFYDTYENYINNLNHVWKESYRVLHPGCRLCVNIGDQFARSVYYGRYKVIPIRTEIIKFCEAIGFDYMGAIIWQKVTTMNTTGGASIMGSFPYPRNGIIKIDYEFILLFKKLGNAPKPTKEQKEISKMTKEEWNMYFSGHWSFPGVKQDAHLAMFPEELPFRLIKMFSFANETVLDPFLGSGTTSLAARNLGRHSIGYEINENYIPHIKDKLQTNQLDLNRTEYIFLQDTLENKYNLTNNLLPYVFVDPHKMDIKIDPKKMQFGSKIDKSKAKREEYYSVKEIISPELLKLDNNLVIRLLGVKTDKEKSEKAIAFIQEKVKGNKVYLKYDAQKYDENNNLQCYVYLQNKTFINAHLLKNNLVKVDETKEFKYKNKFINIG